MSFDNGGPRYTLPIEGPDPTTDGGGDSGDSGGWGTPISSGNSGLIGNIAGLLGGNSNGNGTVPIPGPPLNTSPVGPPGNPFKAPAVGVIASVDNANSPKFATVLINNDLPPLLCTFASPFGPFAAGGTSGFHYFYNNSSNVGGSWCTVDQNSNTIIAVSNQVSLNAPAAIYQAITNHKHSGGPNSDGIQDPQPVNLGVGESQNNLPYGQNSLPIQGAINSNGDVIATEFPGQLIAINSGSYKGLEQQVTSYLQDPKSFIVSTNQTVFQDWVSLNINGNQTSGNRTWGPTFYDGSGHKAGLLLTPQTGSTSAVQYYRDGVSVYSAAAISAFDTNLHFMTASIQLISAGSYRFTLYVDNVKVLDYTDSSSTLTGPISCGFYADAANMVYHRSYDYRSTPVGTDALLRIPPTTPTFTVSAGPTYTYTNPQAYNLSATITATNAASFGSSIAGVIFYMTTHGSSSIVQSTDVPLSTTSYSLALNNIAVSSTATYDVYAAYTDATGNMGTATLLFTTSVQTGAPAGTGGTMPASTTCNATNGDTTDTYGTTSHHFGLLDHGNPHGYLVQATPITTSGSQVNPTWLKDVEFICAPTGTTNWTLVGTAQANASGSYTWIGRVPPYSDCAMRLVDFGGNRSGASAVLFTVGNWRWTLSGGPSVVGTTPNVTSPTLPATPTYSNVGNSAYDASLSLTFDSFAQGQNTPYLASIELLISAPGANVWNHYAYVPAQYSSSVYSCTWPSLGAGNSYDLGVRYTDNTAGVSNVVKVGTTSANPASIGKSQLPTVTGHTCAFSSAAFGAYTTNGGTVLVNLSGTYTFDSNPQPWLDRITFHAVTSGSGFNASNTGGLDYAGVLYAYQLGTATSQSVSVRLTVGAGQAWDIFAVMHDNTGAAVAVTPTILATTTAQSADTVPGNGKFHPRHYITGPIHFRGGAEIDGIDIFDINDTGNGGDGTKLNHTTHSIGIQAAITSGGALQAAFDMSQNLAINGTMEQTNWKARTEPSSPAFGASGGSPYPGTTRATGGLPDYWYPHYAYADGSESNFGYQNGGSVGNKVAAMYNANNVAFAGVPIAVQPGDTLYAQADMWATVAAPSGGLMYARISGYAAGTTNFAYSNANWSPTTWAEAVTPTTSITTYTAPVYTVPAGVNWVTISFWHIADGTHAWTMFVDNVKLYRANNPHATMSVGTQTLVTSTGGHNATDFQTAVEQAPGSSFQGYAAITGGQVYEKTGTATNLATGPFSFSATFKASTSSAIGVIACASSFTQDVIPTTGYLALADPSTSNLRIYKSTTASWTQVAVSPTISPSIATNLGEHNIKVVVYPKGSYNTVWVQYDNSQPFSWDDTTSPLTTGAYGFYNAASTLYLRDHSVSQSVSDALAIIDSFSPKPRKNLIVNGNNCSGSGAVDPNAFGWTGLFGTITSFASGGGWNFGSSFQIVKGTAQGGRFQDFPITPGQTYTYCIVMLANTAGMSPTLWVGTPGYATRWNTTPSVPIGQVGAFYTSQASGSVQAGASTCPADNAWHIVYGTFSVPLSSGNTTARILVYDASTVAGTMYFTGVALHEGNRLQDYIDHELNFGSVTYDKHIVGKMPNSSMMNNTGSLLNVAGTPVYSYSSTTSSITLTIPAATYTLTDNVTTLSIAAFSQTYTGLTHPTGYYFNIAVDIATLTFVVQGPSTSAYTGAQILAWCGRDGRMQVYGNYVVNTPSSGTGGGTGGGGGAGGGCPAAWQEVYTFERGMIRADEIEIGMHLLGPDGSPKRVHDAHLVTRPIWRYTLVNDFDDTIESFYTDDEHPVEGANGSPVLVRDMKKGMRLAGGVTVVDAEYFRDDKMVGLSVEGLWFKLGNRTSHNCHNTQKY